MAKPKGKPENLNPVRTEEEAKEKGRRGGIKSGESRRKKREAKDAIRLLLDLAAKGNLELNLKQLGVEENDRTNMMAVTARLFSKAMEGDVNAYRTLMEYGGFNPDQKLKDQERQARIEAIEKSGGAGAITSGDWGEDGDGGDVIIYMPELDDKVEERRRQEQEHQNKETGEETNVQEQD